MTNKFTLHLGDCLEIMRGMADCSIDAVVCDPPYGLSIHKPDEVLECLRAWLAGEVYAPKGKGFMGKAWDAWVPGPEVWREALRVLKPGGHVLAFAGTRSMDLMSMAIRLAGFELRDAVGYAHDGCGAPLLAWSFGSGFPKNRDVSKAIDKAAGAEQDKVPATGGLHKNKNMNDDGWSKIGENEPTMDSGLPATEAARQWKGWGTALKPAWEPIILARKPLAPGHTVAANVLAHGTGGINVDGCRVAHDEQLRCGTGGMPARHDETKSRTGEASAARVYADAGGTDFAMKPGPRGDDAMGRWPANLIHDGSEEVLAGFPQTVGKIGMKGKTGSSNSIYGNFSHQEKRNAGITDTGSAARFFYCAKASKADRDAGLDAFDEQQAGVKNDSGRGFSEGDPYARVMRKNTHNTVKPTALMAYLVRLVTPPGGIVLDPFMGSGSTGKAAMREGMRFIGCEMSAEYMAIARARIEHEAAAADARQAQAQAPVVQPDLFA